jgi:hypothetical protein
MQANGIGHGDLLVIGLFLRDNEVITAPAGDLPSGDLNFGHFFPFTVGLAAKRQTGVSLA